MKTITFAITIIILLTAIPASADNTENTCNLQHPEWSRTAVMYEANIRQFTKEGTFKAFAQHLPRLKKMGVDVIWLMPIHPISKVKRKGTLGAYYATSGYQQVHPMYGTLEDFKALVEQVHELDMYILMDWVARYTGYDHPWTKEHPDWYFHNKKGELIPVKPQWWDCAALDYRNPEMRAKMIEMMKWWVTEFDIDGYRCDVAHGIPVDFWNKARQELDKVKKVFLLSEAEAPALQLNAFDACYTFDIYNGFYLRVHRGEAKASDLKDYIQSVNKRFCSDSYHLNYTTNHDENAAGSSQRRLGDASRALAVITFTLPGMPLIYGMQEASYDQKVQFFEKDEIDWSRFENEEFYTKLTKLKKQNPALRAGLQGGKMVFNTANNNNVVIYTRDAEDNKVTTIVNITPEVQNVDFSATPGKYIDYFDNVEITLNHKNSMILKPWKYKVFIR